MNIEKKVKIQQRLIEDLQKQNEVLKNENLRLSDELKIEKERQEKSKKLVVDLEEKKTEYEKLITELKRAQEEYKSEIKEIRDLKKKYKKDMKTVINKIVKSTKRNKLNFNSSEENSELINEEKENELLKFIFKMVHDKNLQGQNVDK